MVRGRYYIVFFIILVHMAFPLYAQDDLPSPMSPPRLVNDFAQTFTDSERADLEQILKAYNDSTSTQIYVVTVTDLKGYAVSDYAVRLAEKWGVGQKEKDNGVVILIKPRIGNERGQVFIATGYGVEHILTDGRTGRIIDNYMMPYLQNGDYYNAAKAAIGSIISYLSGEFEGDSPQEGGSILGTVILIIFLILVLYIVSRNNGGGPFNGGRRRWGGYYGGFGGFGGSSSGGGFSGGGGGSFGGGGAGRSF